MSVQPPTHEEIQINDDEVEEEEEDEEEEEEEDFEDIEEVTHGRSHGRGLTLKTLVKEGVLLSGEGHMTINYLGNKFKGNLLPDGRIRSQETNKIFGTPSAWAIYCKKIVNPDKKSGCGWASVRYKGKKLDSYKNNWYRQKRLEFEREGEALDEEEMSDSDSDGPHEQEIVEFEMIGNRHPNHDMNTMVELTSFQALGRMQPFNVAMSSSAMAMMDVHAHLSTSEVVGYLAGQWDVTNHNLIVSHALPVRCRLGDGEKGKAVEQALFTEMEKLSLSLVGWYHTHPFSPPLPSLRDIDSQLEYELKMKGSNDASYTPCIGIIVSPYVRGGGQGTTASGFWVMPPPEHKPQEYGRPMSIQFTIIQDAFIPKETLYHVRDTVKYYKDLPDAIVFSDIFQDRCSYWDKFKTAIRLCVPKDHYAPLVDYLAKLLELKNYTPEPVAPPGKTKSSVPAPKHTQQETSETSTTVAASSTPTSPLRPPTSLNLKLSGDLGPSIDRASPPVIDVSPDEPKPPPGMASPSPPQHVETPIAKVERTASSHVELQRHELFKSKELPQQELKSPPDHHHHHHHHSSRGSPPQYKPFLELYSEHKQDAAPHQSFSQDHHQHHHQDHKHQQHQQQSPYQHQQKHDQPLHQNPPPHQPTQHQHQSQYQPHEQLQQQHQHLHQPHLHQQPPQQQQQEQNQHLHDQQQQHKHNQQQQQQQQQYTEPPQYLQQQSYHQHIPDYEHQQDSYQSDQKGVNEEEEEEDYREPPPSYHQHHFKIPTSYLPEDHQAPPPPPYPSEDITRASGAPHHYQEQVDPWLQGLLRHSDPLPPPLQESNTA